MDPFSIALCSSFLSFGAYPSPTPLDLLPVFSTRTLLHSRSHVREEAGLWYRSSMASYQLSRPAPYYLPASITSSVALRGGFGSPFGDSIIDGYQILSSLGAVRHIIKITALSLTEIYECGSNNQVLSLLGRFRPVSPSVYRRTQNIWRLLRSLWKVHGKFGQLLSLDSAFNICPES